MMNYKTHPLISSSVPHGSLWPLSVDSVCIGNSHNPIALPISRPPHSIHVASLLAHNLTQGSSSQSEVIFIYEQNL